MPIAAVPGAALRRLESWDGHWPANRFCTVMPIARTPEWRRVVAEAPDLSLKSERPTPVGMGLSL